MNACFPSSFDAIMVGFQLCGITLITRASLLYLKLSIQQSVTNQIKNIARSQVVLFSPKQEFLTEEKNTMVKAKQDGLPNPYQVKDCFVFLPYLIIESQDCR